VFLKLENIYFKKILIVGDENSKLNFLCSMLQENLRYNLREQVRRFKPNVVVQRSENFFDSIKFLTDKMVQMNTTLLPFGIELYVDFSLENEYNKKCDTIIFLLPWPYKTDSNVQTISSFFNVKLLEGTAVNTSFKAVFFRDINQRTGATDIDNIDDALFTSEEVLLNEFDNDIFKKMIEFYIYENPDDLIHILSGNVKTLTVVSEITKDKFSRWREKIASFEIDYDLSYVIDYQDMLLEASYFDQIKKFEKVKGSRDIMGTYINNYYYKFFDTMIKCVEENYKGYIEYICFWDLEEDLRILKRKFISFYFKEIGRDAHVYSCPKTKAEYQNLLTQTKLDVIFSENIKNFIKIKMKKFILDYIEEKEKILTEVLNYSAYV